MKCERPSRGIRRPLTSDRLQRSNESGRFAELDEKVGRGRR
jgi:hypothetical protein